jgi:putative long chain acyl-CoA synthase
MLVAVGGAMVGGARLALAPRFRAESFWAEVRRYGVSVVFYAGEMCRRLVDAPPVLGEKNNPVRLFAGSGLRRDVWKRLIDRFGPVGVLEFYASTEANTVLANARGKKIGSAGRPLPFSPDVVVAAWEGNDFLRDGSGHLLRARLDEPGMLIAKLAADRADVSHIDPKRLLRDAFEPGDLWFVTGDFFEVDVEGDFTFVDRQGQMIDTQLGSVASSRIEDAIYAVPGVAVVAAAPAPDDNGKEHAVVAVQLHRTAELDLAALSAAVASLPEYARPRRLAIVDEIPLTDGFRAIKRGIGELIATAKHAYAWDARAQRYVPALEVIRSA